jgi:hypothetical protein
MIGIPGSMNDWVEIFLVWNMEKKLEHFMEEEANSLTAAS